MTPQSSSTIVRPVTVEPGWQLAVALAAFVVLGVAVARAGRLPLVSAIPWAAVRAAVQLVAVSLVVGLALSHPAWAFGFLTVMFTIGVVTTARRTELKGLRPRLAAAAAMAAGAVPVLLIVFLSGAAPLNGAAIVPIGSIVVGNMMTAHTLAGRRFFPELRDKIGIYEGVLALGLPRRRAIWMVLEPVASEPLVPTLDSTRTVGLVTLPGAFIGVLLGGGTPLQAGASQLLVLVGILVGQVITVTVMHRMIAAAYLLPTDLRGALRA